MKVELKLTPRQLNSIVYCFNNVNLVYAKERRHRVAKSILDEIIIKMKKKHVELESQISTLFTKKKDTKFSFKYHEADCLEQYLISIQETPLNEYDRNVVGLLISKLNQQLA